MSEEENVGRLDATIRVLLGIACVVALVYNFAVESIMPIYATVAVIVLVPLFLKTGLTRVCPIMKSLNVSSASRR